MIRGVLMLAAARTIATAQPPASPLYQRSNVGRFVPSRVRGWICSRRCAPRGNAACPMPLGRALLAYLGRSTVGVCCRFTVACGKVDSRKKSLTLSMMARFFLWVLEEPRQHFGFDQSWRDSIQWNSGTSPFCIDRVASYPS
jgi:hypothetical protein